MTIRGAGVLLSLLAVGRPAHAAYWWVSPLRGDDAATGAGPEESLRTLGEAAARAVDGDTIYLGAGEYTEDVRLDADGLQLRAAEGAVFTPTRTGLRVFGSEVLVEGGLWTGGDGQGAALEVRAGGSLTVRGATVRGFVGTGALARGGRLGLETVVIDGVEGAALVVQEGGAAEARDTVLRGFPAVTEPSSLVVATGAGSTLRLVHSTVRGAPRTCVRSLDGAWVELEAVLVTACGVESEATTNNFAVAAGDGAGAAVRASQLMGQGSAPHSRVTSGAVEVDAATVVNGVVDLRGFGQRPTVLAITVDDLPNIDNASALAPVVESVGGRLSFFVNSPELVTDARRAALRELAAAGHEIGGHARSNGLLTQEIPLVLRWDGAGALPVTVSEDGAALTVGTGAAARTWALGTGGLHSLLALCAALGEVDGLTCTVVSTDPSALPTGADPTGLESGTRVLGAGVDTEWPWDRRLPSAGGRHFRNELVLPRELLSEWIGAEVRTLAYPGQRHDAWVREAAADAGFWSARGGSGFTNADHRLWAPFDPFQAPMSLSVDAVKGPGYAALDRPAREERVRAFARAWSAWAREVDAVGALTIHSEGTFSPEELGWLVDALAAEAGWHPTLGALRDRWEAEGLPLEDGRWQMPGGPVDDIVPGPRFAGRDRAPADAARTEDAAGRPIYGAPDIGPFEHQPTGEAGRDGVPFRVPVVVYADGRFDGSPDGLPLGLAPAAVPAAGPRPAWATLTVDGWSAVERRFTVAGGAGAGCLYVGDLGSGASWAWTAPDGTRRTVRADGDGRAAVAWKGGAGAHSWTQGGADAPLAQTCGPRAQDDAAPETPPQEVAARRGAPAAGGCAHAPLGPVGGVLLTGVAFAAARRRRR